MFEPLEKSMKELNDSITHLNRVLSNSFSLTVKEIDYAEVERMMLEGVVERKLVNFMDECHLRTREMRDSEKCKHCKLRFRCYTEATNDKKQDVKEETFAKLYGQDDASTTIPSKPKKRGKRG